MRPLIPSLMLALGAHLFALADELPRVDFSYAFAPPHRLTVALPDSGNKTLLNLRPGTLHMAWSYEDLTRFPPATFMTPATRWEILFSPAVDGHPFARSDWPRLDAWLPALVNRYEEVGAAMRLEVVGTADAAATRITLIWEHPSARHRFTARTGS